MGLNPLMPDLYIGNGRPNAVAYHHHHQNIMKITKITIVITGPYPARLRVDRQALLKLLRAHLRVFSMLCFASGAHLGRIKCNKQTDRPFRQKFFTRNCIAKKRVFAHSSHCLFVKKFLNVSELISNIFLIQLEEVMIFPDKKTDK